MPSNLNLKPLLQTEYAINDIRQSKANPTFAMVGAIGAAKTSINTPKTGFLKTRITAAAPIIAAAYVYGFDFAIVMPYYFGGV